MNMVRLVRRIVGCSAVIAVLALALVVAEANAYNTSQAVSKAAKEQRFDCRWSPVPGWYRCVVMFVVYPKCINTHVNHPFHPQYICGGVFIRQSRLSGNYDVCHTTYYLSPWGHTLNLRTYKCYRGGPLGAKDGR